LRYLVVEGRFAWELTMRIAFLAGFAGVAALGLTVPAVAAPPQITVTYGAKLADKIDQYGARDVADLAASLERSVRRAVGAAPEFSDARFSLVIEDANPNRPTFQQMRDRPGLSMESYGVGGATLSGTLTRSDGSTRTLSYRWYESDIRWARASGTWADAETAIGRFARTLPMD
jgi:hypothetical protein